MNDFTGKTVIPFCTSTSSGIGESDKLLSQVSNTGNWLEGHVSLLIHPIQKFVIG